MVGFLKHLIKKHWREYLAYRELRSRFPSCHFEENIVIKGPIDNLILGKNVQLQSNTVLHLGGMKWCDFKGRLEIGDNSCISPHTIIYAAGPGGVEIGENFDCGPGVKIFSSRSNTINSNSHIFEKVKVGNNVTIFANAVISPGVFINDNSVVLAGAVVNDDVPANSVYGGIPARFIKENR